MSRLEAVRETWLKRSADERRAPAQDVTERMLAYQRECESRASAQVSSFFGVADAGGTGTTGTTVGTSSRGCFILQGVQLDADEAGEALSFVFLARSAMDLPCTCIDRASTQAIKKKVTNKEGIPAEPRRVFDHRGEAAGHVSFNKIAAVMDRLRQLEVADGLVLRASEKACSACSSIHTGCDPVDMEPSSFARETGKCDNRERHGEHAGYRDVHTTA